MFALLSGCVSQGGGTTARSAKSSMSFADGSLKVATPKGYCVTAAGSAAPADDAVTVIGRCEGETALVPAVITISAGAEGSSRVLQSGAKAMSDYFRSPAGRAALARDGASGSVELRQTSLAGGALMMQMVDRSVGEYWRSVFALRGRLITVAVTATETSSLSPDQSRALLEQTITALRAANPAKAARAAE